MNTLTHKMCITVGNDYDGRAHEADGREFYMPLTLSRLSACPELG